MPDEVKALNKRIKKLELRIEKLENMFQVKRAPTEFTPRPSSCPIRIDHEKKSYVALCDCQREHEWDGHTYEKIMKKAILVKHSLYKIVG